MTMNTKRAGHSGSCPSPGDEDGHPRHGEDGTPDVCDQSPIGPLARSEQLFNSARSRNHGSDVSNVGHVARDRFPLEPLRRALASSTMVELALRLGVDRRQVYRWAHYGLTDMQADEAAIRCGLHPAIVWPDWSLSNVGHLEVAA